MNIVSNNRTFVFSLILFIFIAVLLITLLVVSMSQETQGQHWPIPTSDGEFKKIVFQG